MFRTRALKLTYWVLPSLFCLALYWPGLQIWFLHDDFAWLGLRFQVHDFASLMRAIFTPAEHGTFRPLSERGFFLLFSSLFGVNPLPFRIWVFLTQFANLVLLSSIARRLTGSRIAGFLAPVLWVANTVLVGVMTWSSAYMQVLCGFLLLLAFHFFLRHIETGERRYYYWQWAPFMVGFLVMETTIVYPALAAAYAFLCARAHFKKTLPLFVPSAVFTILHMVLAPKQATGLYSIHLDLSMTGTFLTYWRWIFEPRALAYYTHLPPWLVHAGTIIISTALLGFTAWMAFRRRWIPLFFLAWFVIVLLPVLPLRDHVSDYYLTLPTIGIACLAADAIARAFTGQIRGRMLWRGLAAALAAAFLVVSVPEARAATNWWCQRGRRVKAMMKGVERARELHPRKIILLLSVDDTLFWGGILDQCFRAMGISGVFLEPETLKRVQDRPSLGAVEGFVLPAQAILRGLELDEIVVYEVADRPINVTERYRLTARYRLVDKLPQSVDAGNLLTSYLLGPTWYAADGAHRWMPRRATLRIRGPDSAGQRLYVRGYCPKNQMEKGPLTLRVAVDGVAMPEARITKADAGFSFDYPLPAQAVGKAEIEVALEVDRVFVVPGDGREMGLVFGLFEIR